MRDYHDFAADIATATGGDPERARIFEGAMYTQAADVGEARALIIGGAARSARMRKLGYRECPGCQELIHDGTLSCGRCGTEIS